MENISIQLPQVINILAGSLRRRRHHLVQSRAGTDETIRYNIWKVNLTSFHNASKLAIIVRER